MHVISLKKIKDFVKNYPDSEESLNVWYRLISKTTFSSFSKVRELFPSADKVKHLIIFNIAGNKYRLISSIHFNRGRIYIRDILTHKEYDREGWKHEH